MNQINAQTHGPIEPTQGGSALWSVANGRTYPVQAVVIAETRGRYRPECPLIEWPQEEANARLLASAYTAFDKAGRELGLDAATLAESIDLAALIRLARGAANIIADEYPHTDGRKFTGTRLQTMLDKICTP